MPRDRGLIVVSVYPSILGTYGDSGNATILVERARRRGIPASVVVVEPFDHVPRLGDVYLLGGAEDAAQAVAAEALARDGGLRAAVDGGASVFAVCAGFQLLGEFFPAGTRQFPGLELLDATTHRLGRRAVGEILVHPAPDERLSLLTGYENHASGTLVGPEATPLGRVEVGVGNGDGSEGARQGGVVATYLHGPAFARNPALADLVLEQVAGPLPSLADPLADKLHAERIRAARAGDDRPRSGLWEAFDTVRRRGRSVRWWREL
jgi:lipid II isoglutaminyl synthase (glutamine-hydrolysing)